MYHDPVCNFKNEKLQIYIYIPKYELDQILQTNHKIKNPPFLCGFHRTQYAVSETFLYV
jgi:hypothetical protein